LERRLGASDRAPSKRFFSRDHLLRGPDVVAAFLRRGWAAPSQALAQRAGDPTSGRMYSTDTHSGLPHPIADARFYSGVPLRRLLAFVIDSVVIVLVGLGLTLVFGVVTLGTGFVLLAPVMGMTGLVYRIASLARWSATPGMWLCGIEMRRRDGQHFGIIEALVHTVMFALCLATGFLQVISIATMALAPLGRGLPDMLLGSAAINRPA
jgi:uncharacterized RDD family membrane protein YckC